MEGLIGTYLIVLLISAVISGYLTRAVAKDKGHDGTPWFWGGFFFGPLGLIAAAGLSDRKLRNYIRQIGEKQDAITPEPLRITAEERQEERPNKFIGNFELDKTAEEDAIWEKIISMLNPDIANKADLRNSYLDDSFLGGTEFVVNDRNGETLAYATRKEYSENTYQWKVSMA